MQVHLKGEIAKRYITYAKIPEDKARTIFGSHWNWGECLLQLDGNKKDQAFAQDMLDFYSSIVKDTVSTERQQTYKVISQLKTYFAALNKDFNKRITSLRSLPMMIVGYLHDTTLDRCMWVVSTDDDTGHNKYGVVKEVKYQPRDRYTPEHVTISIVYNKLGEFLKTTQSIWKADLKLHKNVPNLIADLGYRPFNNDDVDIYNEHVTKFMQCASEIGEQFKLTGTGHTDATGYLGDRFKLNFSTDRSFTKAILDTFTAELDRNKRDRVNARDWIEYSGATALKVKEEDEYDSDDEIEDEIDSDSDPVDSLDQLTGKGKMINESLVKVPYLPILRLFSLEHHTYVTCHVDNAEKYEYDENLVNKLVLDDDVKELVGFLVESVGVGMSDIIQGKSAGVIIAALGLPGIGKTLTGEVFSEKIKRPLYTVQASQLGVKLEGLEDTLKLTLARANRWKAILTIDEADVYIRERGGDLIQNAVVGTFLRVLEYYAGVLFMTSNRATIIDDAILSRCSAVIHYQPPTGEQQHDIWRILAAEFNHKLNDNFIADIMKKVGTDLTGREIKNLLKLSILRAKRINNSILTPDIVEFVSRYQNYVVRNEKEKNENTTI